MTIVTWNVNSLKARHDYVAQYLDEESPDVLCIQELKLDADNIPMDLFISRGYHVAFHAQKAWNGVLIASKTPLSDIHHGLPPGGSGEGEKEQARLIAATTEGIRLVNVYCPQGSAADSPKFPYKLSFFDALIPFMAAEIAKGGPVCLLGDINIAPRPEDLWDVSAFEGVPTYHPEEHARFQALLDLGLEDAVWPHIKPGTFTFWDYRGMAFRFNKGMRIDHLLITPDLNERVETAWVERPWRKKKGDLKASDHAPVALRLT